MELSIIIVNYNTKDLTTKAIESILNRKWKVKYEIIVVDNDSTDGSNKVIKEKFTQVKLINNKENLGFAKANNIGIKQSNGCYILLLNSDTIVKDNTIDQIVQYMEENREIGAAGCKVVLPDGSLDLACKRSFPTPQNALYNALKLDKFFPDNKRFGDYNLTYLDENEINEVDCLVGAFMMIRREVLEEVGLLDEDYFMYGEDIDLCYRIKQAGWKIVYYPEVEITHYKGGGRGKKSYHIIYEFYRSMYLFYNKHYKNKYSFLTRSIVYIGVFFRCLLAILLNIFK